MAVVLKMVNIRIILVIKNLEKEMGKHSSILAWRTPYTEKPGGLQSMWSQRVGHDWATEQQQ